MHSSHYLRGRGFLREFVKPKCVIVMDNAQFHKHKRIQKLLNRHGRHILLLLPYSPDLNPIEKKMGASEVSMPRLDGE